MASTHAVRSSHGATHPNININTNRHNYLPSLEPDNQIQFTNRNSVLSLSQVFRRVAATAAGIDLDHPDPDAITDGWLRAPTGIFRVHLENNKYLEPFEYSGHKISALHLIYAFLTYGLQPNDLALDLLKKVVKHKAVRDLMRLFFRMKGKPLDDQDLLLQLKQGYDWDDVVERLFAEKRFARGLQKWARRYFAGLLVPSE
ncbi:hypothetical protein AA313_de0209581 [Arthrobotrys entomopaga]|nr:hypothetical protein AA313_de0209581 [Arthrobotrys entomopaga]